MWLQTLAVSAAFLGFALAYLFVLQTSIEARRYVLVAAMLALLAALPFAIRTFAPASEKYYLHLLIQIWLWSFVYTGWSLMGRFGLTSLGHGAFTGIGAYVTVMLWNFAGITPLIGIPVAILTAMLGGLLIGYPSFRLRITGHYFALLTLAFTEFVRLCLVGFRTWTGGSLGTQPRRHGDGISLYAVQFEPDRVLAYFIAFGIWLVGLYIWNRVDRSMDRYALDAASQDEDAAASVGIDVTRVKLKITAISSGMCAFGGAMYGQYQMYIGPDTVAGLGLSLAMVFASIAGGLGVLLGPTFGAFFTQVLSETLRIIIQGSAWLKTSFGSNALVLDQVIYGMLLVLFIIYMPRGILGSVQERWNRRGAARSASVAGAGAKPKPAVAAARPAE
jgi:branched-chain amino acid transport system permease protein